MKTSHLPTPAVRRLSLYLRELEAFLGRGRRTVSSRQLGQALGLTAAQVRKDLTYFGQFGRPGVGYRVEELIAKVRQILGTDRTSNVLLVGVGNLGRALLAYRNFPKKGFQIVAAFDTDPDKIGQELTPLDDVRVQPLSEIQSTVRERSIRLGVICVPATEAQGVADRLVDAGIRGLLNFAPVSLNLPASVRVVGADLAIHLEQLSFQIGGGNVE
jgi:redox-sensing transcriptional repressor